MFFRGFSHPRSPGRIGGKAPEPPSGAPAPRVSGPPQSRRLCGEKEEQRSERIPPIYRL